MILYIGVVLLHNSERGRNEDESKRTEKYSMVCPCKAS